MIEVKSRRKWREWLRLNHDTSGSVWLVNFKQSSGGPHVLYDEIVEEALCFGWIDGLRKKFDEQRTQLLLSPRKAGSIWSKSNRERVERLIAEGQMTPAGQAKIDRAKADGSWLFMKEVEELTVPDDFAAALKARPPARKHFDAFPPSVKRGILAWIKLAKRPETRQRRIEKTTLLTQKNQRVTDPA